MCLTIKQMPDNLPEEITAYKTYLAVKIYDNYELVSPVQRYPIKKWGDYSTTKPTDASKDSIEERVHWPINEIPLDTSIQVAGFHCFKSYEDALNYADARNSSARSEIGVVIPVKLLKRNIFLYGTTPFFTRYICGHRELCRAETYVSTEIHISQADYNKALGKSLEAA